MYETVLDQNYLDGKWKSDEDYKIIKKMIEKALEIKT